MTRSLFDDQYTFGCSPVDQLSKWVFCCKNKGMSLYLQTATSLGDRPRKRVAKKMSFFLLTDSRLCRYINYVNVAIRKETKKWK